MPIKRGTKVIFTGSNVLGGESGNGNVGWWRDKQIKYYSDKYGLEVGNKGKTCGGYSGGWVKITWTRNDGSKVSSVPMRSEHFQEEEPDSPLRREHLIDFEDQSPAGRASPNLTLNSSEQILPALTLTEQVNRANLMTAIRKLKRECYETIPIQRQDSITNYFHPKDPTQETFIGPKLELNIPHCVAETPRCVAETPDKSPPIIRCNLEIGNEGFSPVYALRKVLKQTRTEREILKEEKAKLIEANERLSNDLWEKNQEIWKLSESYRLCIDTITRRDDQIDDLKRDSNSLNSRLEDSEKETTKYLGRNRLLEDEIGYWKEDLEASEKRYSVANSASMELANRCSQLRVELEHTREQVSYRDSTQTWGDYSEEPDTQDSGCQTVAQEYSDEFYDDCYSGPWFQEFEEKLKNMNDIVGRYKTIIDVQQSIMMNIASKMNIQAKRLDALEEKNLKDSSIREIQIAVRNFLKNKRDSAAFSLQTAAREYLEKKRSDEYDAEADSWQVTGLDFV